MTSLARAWRMARRFQEVASDRIGEVTTREPSIQPHITCPLCGKTSYHPRDIEEGYCGLCHWWTGRKDMLADRLEFWVLTYARKREVPTGCTLHPAVLDALVLVLQRGSAVSDDPLV